MKCLIRFANRKTLRGLHSPILFWLQLCQGQFCYSPVKVTQLKAEIALHNLLELSTWKLKKNVFSLLTLFEVRLYNGKKITQKY